MDPNSQLPSIRRREDSKRSRSLGKGKFARGRILSHRTKRHKGTKAQRHTGTKGWAEGFLSSLRASVPFFVTSNYCHARKSGLPAKLSQILARGRESGVGFQ